NQPRQEPEGGNSQESRSTNRKQKHDRREETESEVTAPSAAKGKVRNNPTEVPSPPATKSDGATPQLDDEFRNQSRTRKSHSQSKRARSMKAATGQTRGRYSRSVAFKTSGSRVALDATLRALAVHQTTATDAIRYKLLKHKEGTLFIFAIDT